VFNYNGKTENDLRSIAQRASGDFLTNGTELTQAVVKAASETASDYTSEHIRRICEMTYHDTYTRMFNEKQGSADRDRYITFDPPNAIVAADLYQKSVGSSLPVGGTTPTMLGKMAADTVVPMRRRSKDPRYRLEKMASANEEVMDVRFSPRNQFDEMMGKYAERELPYHDPKKQARDLYMGLKEAKVDISGRLASAETSEKLAMMNLVAQAKQMSKEGAATDEILHACFSACDMQNNHVAETAKKIASELALTLPREKLAGEFGQVNSNHPLLSKFAEAVKSRSERVHLEYAYSDLQQGEEDVKKALFGS